MAKLALFLVISTLPVWVYLRKRRIFESQALTFAAAWFIGQWLAATSVGVVASVLSPFTDVLLVKAIWIYMACAAAASLASARLLPAPALRPILRLTALLSIGWIAAGLLLPQHLGIRDGWIHYSPVYGDFSAHFTLLQTFVFGDNFPPQNEGAAGLPVMYHFFYHLLVAIYSVLGLDLVEAINFASCLTLAFLIVLIVGLGEQLFRSTAAGIAAALFFLSNSSLRFLAEASDALLNGVGPTVAAILEASSDPYGFALRSDGTLYNGNMFNLFYLVAERHLIFGCGLTGVFLALLCSRSSLSRSDLLLAGAMMGLSFFWHLYVAIGIGAVLALLCISPRYRRQTVTMLVPFLVLFAIQAGWMAWLSSFRDPVLQRRFAPIKLDTSFVPQLSGRKLSFWPLVHFYLFAFGFKIPAALGGFALLRSRREPVLVLACSVLAFFALTNFLALGSISVLNNHKFVKPLDLGLSILAGGAVQRLACAGSGAGIVLALPATLLLTASGIIENLPVIRAGMTYPYAPYPSELTRAVRTSSRPRDVFQTANPQEILLAGRKVFYATRHKMGRANSMFFAFYFHSSRTRAIAALYGAGDAAELCRVARENGIDFVEFDGASRQSELFARLGRLGRFEVRSEVANDELTYIDIGDCPG